ncbi:Heavy metal-associated isoprenylated plant protein [Melia azedarach]|uniref:Heavy metal-associated isoprenylated plant protein n=1 Tax=Melia azedarach TaxID=155640 RepID=A0ACC1YVJ2_MELAZ|nr:Heavy metal-associated isoprenylated plant protein [Melia azedarach]
MAAKEEKKAEGVITAVYKVNLHCPQCARKIKKPLLRTQGVQSVDVDFEKSEIKVKGVIDVIKIHKLIEKLSKKKVELISPQVKLKESSTPEIKKPQEIKEAPVRTTTVKVHMHCDKCEHDLRKKLLRHRGIFSVKTDMKAQTLTVQGTIEPDKLLTYLRKKVHKHAEIVTSKPEKKEEKKETSRPEKEEEKKETSRPEKKEEKKETKEKKVEVKPSTESITKGKIVEFKEEVKVEAKTKEGNVPYFVHYVYAPQLFSDENPNACFVM